MTAVVRILALLLWSTGLWAATQIGNVPAPATSFTDTTAGALVWCYQVIAYNVANIQSDPSNAACGKGPNIVLTWSAPTKNTDGSALTDLSGYLIFRSAPSPAKPSNFGVH